MSRREGRSPPSGTGALLYSGCGIAQTNPRRIDVHHHFQPPIDGDAGLKWWTPEKSLEMMDKFGIAFAMMSNPGASASAYAGTQKGNDAARRSNEFGAKRENAERLYHRLNSL